MNTEETEIYELENDLPTLNSGKYTIKVTQNTNQGIDYATEQFFFIAGERFHIQREEIGGVYPPKNGLGDYSKVAPHLVLNRSTLPWERQPQESNTDHAPWLSLLLFTESEIKATGGIQTIPLATLKVGTTGSDDDRRIHPAFDLEPGQVDTDLVQVLNVTKADIEEKLPKDLDEIKSCVRVNEVHNDQEKVTKAYLTAKGQITQEEQYRVVLVSLENRYKANAFDFQGATATDRIRLVVLYAWSFTCSHEGRGFADVIQGLSMDSFSCPVPVTAEASSTAMSAAQPMLMSGYSPVPHQMRRGGQSVSWYRGPLIPTSPAETDRFTAARSSDIWLKYHEQMGMIDVSYAAAWDLGRLLSLRNQSFSDNLYQWKREFIRNKHFHDQHGKFDTHHLKTSADTGEIPMPEVIKDFLERLSKLEEIPFHYLMPQESMLPEESIRFFQLDFLWVYALMDGALSLGRVTSKSNGTEHQMLAQNQFQYEQPMTGFLLRSEAVSNWPDFKIMGFGRNDVDLTLIKRKKPGKQVLLCLFDGELEKVDLFLDHSQMHFEWRGGRPVRVSGERVRCTT